MGYEEMASDAGYGAVGTPENEAMAAHLEQMDQDAAWLAHHEEEAAIYYAQKRHREILFRRFEL